MGSPGSQFEPSVPGFKGFLCFFSGAIQPQTPEELLNDSRTRKTALPINAIYQKDNNYEFGK
jgi:hypothetical protein